MTNKLREIAAESGREWWLDIATPYGDLCDFIHDADPYAVAKKNGTHPCVSATNIHVTDHAQVEKLKRALIAAAEVIEIQSEALEFYSNGPIFEMNIMGQSIIYGSMAKEALESARKRLKEL